MYIHFASRTTEESDGLKYLQCALGSSPRDIYVFLHVSYQPKKKKLMTFLVSWVLLLIMVNDTGFTKYLYLLISRTIQPSAAGRVVRVVRLRLRLYEAGVDSSPSPYRLRVGPHPFY